MTWSVIKEAIGKNSSRQQKSPNKINLRSKFITSTDSIAKNFNKKVSLKLVQILQIKKISSCHHIETSQLICSANNMCNIFQPENALSINKLKDAFYSLKTNKSQGYDEISSNIIKQCFGTLHRPLHYIYNISLQLGAIPE